jgi:hypothetical protein
MFGGMLIGFILQASDLVVIDEPTLADVLTKKDRRAVNKNFTDLLQEAKELKLQETLRKIENGEYKEPFMINEPEVPSAAELNPSGFPKFRILRSIRNEHEIKCFIINEGDTIALVSAEAPLGIKCEIIPSKEFKTKTTGVLRFENLTSPEKVQVYLSFNNCQRKEFIYDPLKNTFAQAELNNNIFV